MKSKGKVGHINKTTSSSKKSNQSMSSTLASFEKNVERWTHHDIATLRNETIEETRKSLKLKGFIIRLFSEFPFIGRGNILKDKILSHEDVEKELDRALN